MGGKGHPTESFNLPDSTINMLFFPHPMVQYTRG